MSIPVITARPICDDVTAKKQFCAEFLDESHYDILLTESTDVVKPNGKYLVRFRKNVIPDEIYKNCLPAIRKAANWTGNRGVASGDPERKPNGQTKSLVRSGVVGSFDRQGGRVPFCRLTTFNREHPQLFDTIRPLAKTVDNQFKMLMPEQYEMQKDMARRTDSTWKIDDTAFTTITINKNWRTATHTDAGDYKDGFGMMCAFSSENYDGGYTVLPQFRVAFDLRIGDVVAFDVHEWHGNTDFKRHKGTGPMERISCVFYYREKMFQCGTMKQELDRAKDKFGQIYNEYD
jgi:hypothetical protein